MLISLVVPVFNEQETIETFYHAARNDCFLKTKNVEIIFVNDGSADKTAQLIEELVAQDTNVRLINFSRNFGKEPALFCGLVHSRGDIVIPMDVDLQDPIELIETMYYKWEGGAKMVLAKRGDRSRDHWLKRVTANYFYKVHNALSHSKIEENVGDFRLMDRCIVDIITSLQEKNLFMKGLLSWPGFDPVIVEYKRPERSAGTTKFNTFKLLNLAIEGITNFSTSPLKLASYVGFGISFLSFLYGISIIIQKLLFSLDVPGYASLITVMVFLGGVQLITIGILGEYVGRIYTEVKARPQYVIESIHEATQEEILPNSSSDDSKSVR
ncbi:TPA: glycosyltransferase family 2 protein [Vibrio parahaemolyticus]|uniref:glycosyltransferase family 2 protein n=1 Tax=Vibrio parahaemolyticus TaxID=670 RepID=UPI001124AD10|nr:glycosyltransferase family 2 protein [Vibrio parahaemolyticus]TOP44952.1 glycosyltransferase [Vibrio parahaemolyticus]HCE1931049.1 glycosyltransferase family 2 protein [Vibrio parahaemolyticus]HCG8322520.1 glycosyltransferase family 2 protein [Vibrio parahaemolyticus]HCH0711294.1 glycosyltransferase family 2 protein [Vibrio parahaemolyticus]